MTATQLRIVALVALGAALLYLAFGLVRRSAAERDGTALATATIDRLTKQNDTLRTIARVAVADARTFKGQRDSLLKRERQPRSYERRQYTPVVIDVADTLSVVTGITALVAERDTALADRDLARADVERLRIKLLVLDSLATQHAADDSVRWTHVVTIADSADAGLQRVRAVVKPRWWKRWGRGLGRAAKVGGVAVIAFAIGRAT